MNISNMWLYFLEGRGVIKWVVGWSLQGPIILSDENFPDIVKVKGRSRFVSTMAVLLKIETDVDHEKGFSNFKKIS